MVVVHVRLHRGYFCRGGLIEKDFLLWLSIFLLVTDIQHTDRLIRPMAVRAQAISFEIDLAAVYTASYLAVDLHPATGAYRRLFTDLMSTFRTFYNGHIVICFCML